MRLKRILIIGTIFPVLFSLVLFFGILISGEDDDSSNSYSPVYSGMNLSADVLKHQPMVEKYARENGISEYVNVLLAIIQVESGGICGHDIYVYDDELAKVIKQLSDRYRENVLMYYRKLHQSTYRGLEVK